MKNFNIKDALLGLSAIILYFVLSSIQTLPFDIVGLRVDILPKWCRIAYVATYEIMIVAILLLIFNKTIEKNFKDILLNHKEIYSKCIKYWLIGLAVMLISNSFIIFVLDNGIAGNEENIRQALKASPIYIYISSVFFAPIIEELVFRQGIRNIFGRNIVFVLISGLLFGSLHVMTDYNSVLDLFYIIPYSSLGIAFAYMLYKTDNIFASMGFHFMHNGIMVALQFLVILFS